MKCSRGFLLIFLAAGLVQQAYPQQPTFHLLDDWSVDFVQDVTWGRYESRRNELLSPPYEGRIHLNEPPGWTTFDAVWTARDGYNKIKYWCAEEFPGSGTGTDWRVEWRIDIVPFSIGQGCMTEFQWMWDDDPDADPDFQEAGWFAADFSLGYISKYYSKLDSDLVWLCGSDVPGHKYAHYAPAFGWTGIPIIMRFSKIGRNILFEAQREGETEFTELYRMPCAISASPRYLGWSLSCTGEWGATQTMGNPWSGKAQYFNVYTSAEPPRYSVDFSTSDSLDPFMIVPGTESPDKYSFSENPGWLRIHTEYANEDISTAKNQLLQYFAPNIFSDFSVVTRFRMDASEAGQAFGMKLTLITTAGVRKEATCYFGCSSEDLLGMPEGKFFAAGLKDSEIATDASGIDSTIFLRMARVGTDVFIDYSVTSKSQGYRRLKTLHGMDGGLLNVLLAAANFSRWGADAGTPSVPVDIRSIEIETRTVDVEPYYSMDNDFCDDLEPFVIPEAQKDTTHYSLRERPGWLRLKTQYSEQTLDSVRNVLTQSFAVSVSAGISVVTRVDMMPSHAGQVFGMQLTCIQDGQQRQAVLRFGAASDSVTGGGYGQFFEYGFEGDTRFVDASSMEGRVDLKIERYGYKFNFQYRTESTSDYTLLGSASNAMGLITKVTLAAGNLRDYGATHSAPSMSVDIDYFRYEDNMMSSGQCEFLNGLMPSPWHLRNADSTKLSFTERAGWLKIQTSFNEDLLGRPSGAVNGIRAEFLPPNLGISGDFDFTMLFEYEPVEPGQVLEVNLEGVHEYFIRYGILNGQGSVSKIQAGIDSVHAEVDVPDLGPVVGLRIVRHASTILFHYSKGEAGEWLAMDEVDLSSESESLRYVTIAACNNPVYGATESTSTIPIYFDYFRFNSINDFLSDVTETREYPDEATLDPNYPNPFNARTEIRYRIPKSVKVQLTIYNILGQRVRTLVDAMQNGGYHTIGWDGRNDLGLSAASGVYLVVLNAGGMYKTNKMVMLK